MQYKADSPEHYIGQLPEDRKEPISKLRQIIKNNLPKGFEEGILYGMIGYYVPHALYPNGYHCDPKSPLPFMNLASQKMLSIFIILVFIPHLKFTIGLLQNTQNMVNAN